ncbi:MAG: SCP2 sterol-binding domain-containing protein [Pseudomonadota bacterium]
MQLDILFKPVAALINRRIGEQTPARDLAAKLEGSILAIRVADTALSVYMTMNNGKLALATDVDADPDVALSGSPLSLAALAGSDPQGVIREGRVQMIGDAEIGQDFQQLLGYARPDIEDELANVVGDVVAGQAGAMLRSAGRAADNFSDQLQARFGTFLTRDKKALPTREQFDAFRDDNERLRDDIERATARLNLLKQSMDEAT